MSTTEKRPVIEVTGLKKQYKLGQIGGGTLTHDLQSWWARVRGKEDPNTVIGTDQRLFGQTFMALNGVDLTVYQGEALGIIGRNGAGKSTLLKLLSRILANPRCSSCSPASRPPPRVKSKFAAAWPRCWRSAPASTMR